MILSYNTMYNPVIRLAYLDRMKGIMIFLLASWIGMKSIFTPLQLIFSILNFQNLFTTTLGMPTPASIFESIMSSFPIAILGGHRYFQTGFLERIFFTSLQTRNKELATDLEVCMLGVCMC